MNEVPKFQQIVRNWISWGLIDFRLSALNLWDSHALPVLQTNFVWFLFQQQLVWSGKQIKRLFFSCSIIPRCSPRSDYCDVKQKKLLRQLIFDISAVSSAFLRRLRHPFNDTSPWLGDKVSSQTFSPSAFRVKTSMRTENAESLTSKGLSDKLAVVFFRRRKENLYSQLLCKREPAKELTLIKSLFVELWQRKRKQMTNTVASKRKALRLEFNWVSSLPNWVFDVLESELWYLNCNSRKQTLFILLWVSCTMLSQIVREQYHG